MLIDSPLRPVLQQLVFRAIEGDTCLGRITSLIGQPKRPMAGERKLERLKALMQDL